MTSAFDKAIEAAFNTHRKVAGKSVTYRAGAEEIEISSAVRGSTIAESTDGGGQTVRSLVVDWLIHVADLAVDDAEIEPASGHQIEWLDGDRLRVFVVAPTGSDECWRFSGPNNIRYRIHTKEVSP